MLASFTEINLTLISQTVKRRIICSTKFKLQFQTRKQWLEHAILTSQDTQQMITQAIGATLKLARALAQKFYPLAEPNILAINIKQNS